MKLFKTTALIVTAALWMTACEVKVSTGTGSKTENEQGKASGTEAKASSPETGTASKLEGTWIVRNENGDDKGNVGTSYEFKGNRLTTTAQGMSLPGNVEVGDNSFSFLMDASASKEKIVYNYSFEGETLVLKMADGPQVFQLTKQ